ncbi:hypothetical protein [Paraliomyxa miuraensis]|uniref:hypothetical protein n=1 Tax=Paraliomyxa miuraensis TaxID=376150 RepID=UPI00224E329B|nr:hypothetical protein [Paraliomyxa miuraensis]MCX4246423.1 hypothetical protein [Paraliomyxa miuraensis]
MDIQEFIGRSIGVTAVAPFTLLGSLIRGNRLFHPDGMIYAAHVKAIAQDGILGQLAQRLAGTALVRLSGAFWSWPRGQHAPDILGAAVRFRAQDDVTPKMLPGDQDLTFVTAPSLPELLVAPFRTNVEDFLGDRYYAILPYTLKGIGKVYLRLVPAQASPIGTNRRQRLELAVDQGNAVLRLELRPDGTEQWVPIVAVDLRERLHIDDELRFDPGSSAMGLRPRGTLQWMRAPAYAASEIGRRLRR